MHLKYISITGADDAVDPSHLVALSREFPAAEWAILLLPPRAGTPRFPKLDWIKSFAHKAAGCHTAMHLCGEALLGFVAGEAAILDAMQGFSRIQLNLKFGDVEGKYDAGALLQRVADNPRWQFIIQYAKDKQGLLPLLKDIPNHAVLFDESAGRGISPRYMGCAAGGAFLRLCGRAAP